MTGLSTKMRRRVADRDRGHCLRCGRRATNVQHRIGRGMGGTSRPEPNGHITAHPAEAYATGWAIRRSETRHASEIPLTNLDGQQFFLTEEGEIAYVTSSPEGRRT